MLEKKKWVVKMVILDSKDAKVSDISQIKDMLGDSTVITKKVRFPQI